MEVFIMTGNVCESMIEELFCVAQCEIIENKNNKFDTICCGNCSIDDNSFTYIYTGTAFGAYLEYDINCAINTVSMKEFGIDILDYLETNEEGSYVRLIPKFDEDNYAEIEFTISVRGEKVDVKICADGIYYYEKFYGYNDYLTTTIMGALNVPKFKNLLIELSNDMISEIHRTLSNVDIQDEDMR
jgi:hypothetical protein